ncbi:MAG: peptidoglycan editing factor PgeF [Gammaproteobacteria bacterium]|nr:peptidoglycan editing factor PgeF [Gammaproteobacteria bacterium]
MNNNLFWLPADWPAPANIRAGTTLRSGGVSQAPYHSLNLGDHVDDDPAAVTENRQRLITALQLPSEPVWLKQVHSKVIVDAANTLPGTIEADGSYTIKSEVVCAVLTADCLPVLICNQPGTQVAAVHAGWRGLADGIIETALEKFAGDKSKLMVWLGPAIGADNYEVGNDVRAYFLAHDPAAASAFKHRDQPLNQPPVQTRKQPGEEKWLMDIYQLAHQRLNKHSITAIYGGEFCTFKGSEKFYSYRRDGITGRMASLIWID